MLGSSLAAPDLTGGYHDNERLIQKLEGLARDHPQLCKTYNLDEKTIEGRDLKVIQIGK